MSITWFPLGILFTDFIRSYKFLIFFLPKRAFAFHSPWSTSVIVSDSLTASLLWLLRIGHSSYVMCSFRVCDFEIITNFSVIFKNDFTEFWGMWLRMARVSFPCFGTFSPGLCHVTQQFLFVGWIKPRKTIPCHCFFYLIEMNTKSIIYLNPSFFWKKWSFR